MGANPVVTGADGKAQIGLVGTEKGKATVKAAVLADAKEATRIVRIGKGGYFEDFEAPVGPEWSQLARTTAGNTTWLGAFRHETADLSLTDLPPHNRVFLSFDLLIIGFWQGGGCTIHDHPWYTEDGTYMGKVDVAVGTPQFSVLHTPPGSATPSNVIRRTNQVYNETTLCDVEREPLAELTAVLSSGSSTYHFDEEFQHVDYAAAGALTIRFWEDERFVDTLTYYGIDVAIPQFAIDNVSVEACLWSAGTGCQ